MNFIKVVSCIVGNAWGFSISLFFWELAGSVRCLWKLI